MKLVSAEQCCGLRCPRKKSTFKFGFSSSIYQVYQVQVIPYSLQVYRIESHDGISLTFLSYLRPVCLHDHVFYWIPHLYRHSAANRLSGQIFVLFGAALHSGGWRVCPPHPSNAVHPPQLFALQPAKPRGYCRWGQRPPAKVSAFSNS